MNEAFATEKISRLIWRMAPPVMFARLIQALYNIVDSYFVGQYSDAGLTALSVVFPIQLIGVAIAVGIGVGANTLIAKYNGEQTFDRAGEVKKTGTLVNVLCWIFFAVLSVFVMPVYFRYSISSGEVLSMAMRYGMIVNIGSVFLFVESMWTKILQAEGNMRIPMIAQIAGAGVNMVLDPVLIVGAGPFPALGVTGAAIATLIGQLVAAVIVGRAAYTGMPSLVLLKKHGFMICRAGFPNVISESLCSIYISAMNMILVTFSEAAVTVLGLYYKLQTFLFIPMSGLQNCMVPVISFNYAAGQKQRCSEMMKAAAAYTIVFMGIGSAAFLFVPELLLQIFTASQEVLLIGKVGFRIIGSSFILTGLTFLFAVYFQAIGQRMEAVIVAVLRQIVLLAPLAWLFSRWGLSYFWLTYPVSEFVTLLCSLWYYRKPIGKKSKDRLSESVI